MTSFNPGDVVLVPFPFSDSFSERVRIEREEK